MNRSIYLQELRERLYFRGATRQQANEIVAEVDSHLAESGEDPVEAFGTPDRYAALLLRGRWHTARFLIGLVAAIGAGLLLGGMAVARNFADEAVSIRASDLAFGVLLLLAAAGVTLPVVHRLLPRQGARLLVLAILIGCGSYVSALVGNTTVNQQVLMTLSLPGVITASLALVAVVAVVTGGPHLRRWWRRSRAARTGQPR
jgi:hypothetical protein